MRRPLSIVATALALAALPCAHASDRYAGISAGLWMPDGAGAAVRTELDDGVAGELRAGWRFGDRFALEGAAGGFRAERSLPPADVTETTLHSVTAWHVLVTGRGYLPLGAVRFGASAGIGYYSADLKVKDPPPVAERRTSGTDTAFHFGVGADFAVTERYRIGLEYRRVAVSPDGIDTDGAAVLLAGEYRY